MSRLSRFKIGLGMVILFFLAYFSLDLWALSLDPVARGVFAPLCESWRRLVLTVAFGCLGFFRIVRRHPACNKLYTAWLQTTPWTSDMPLPMGPVQLG
jgi:hypothetical protein